MKRLLCMGFMLLFSLNMLVEPSSARAEAQEHRVSQPQVTFENEFRRLWMDHVLWTSNYITSATTAASEDQKQVLARLLKNQEDIGNAVKPIYGEKAGNKLTALLKEHIVIAGKIVDAAKTGKKALVNQLNKEWYRNADDIAAFLSQANPYLKNEDLKKLLYMHLKLVTNDLSASLEKDWEARIVAIDEGVSHIILMADTISAGVVKQFPKKFNK
ncbi:glycosyltransferase [Priestia aryabhattai]|uniref:Glycosyltransferase n=1 Tax=Priestia aryabhattai TaxID=412384 RepID=A0AAX6N2U4_PRIAR|nr:MULTISPECIES: glycosyltransferase [Priestia]MDU9690107.1 glycosyltransferase [Priestia aryabhattai]QDZ81145.1 glycosyltransferase [Priestia megaterium]TPF18367.1 glycosyltransferase [Priestia megaterium]TPF22475.1 glycosyltransferase [Priestia megaterium]